MKFSLNNKIKITLIATALLVASFGNASAPRQLVQQELNICYPVTPNRLNDVTTSITSLAYNTPNGIVVNVFVGEIFDQPGDEAIFAEFAEKFSPASFSGDNPCFRLYLLDLSVETEKAKLYALQINSGWHWSIFTKLFIAENPAFANLPHLCLVDSDTIFVGSVAPLIEIKLDEQLWAAVNVKATDSSRTLRLIAFGSRFGDGEDLYNDANKIGELVRMTENPGLAVFDEKLPARLRSFEMTRVDQLIDSGSNWILDSGVFVLNIPHILANNIVLLLEGYFKGVISAKHENSEMLTDESIFGIHSTRTRTGLVLPFRFNVNIDQTRDRVFGFMSSLAKTVKDGEPDLMALQSFNTELTHYLDRQDRHTVLLVFLRLLSAQITAGNPSFISLLPSVAAVNEYIYEELNKHSIVYHMQGSDAKFGTFPLNDPRINCGYGWTWAAYRVLSRQLQYDEILANFDEGASDYITQYLGNVGRRYRSPQRLPKYLAETAISTMNDLHPQWIPQIFQLFYPDEAQKQSPKPASKASTARGRGKETAVSTMSDPHPQWAPQLLQLFHPDEAQKQPPKPTSKASTARGRGKRPFQRGRRPT
ncbi:MAG: hypothetical protein LBL30_01600 [Holosporales bacterium]|jgi:hypothetical protein|nr:hypothetical protein [Holosporales bacterium]